MRKIIISSFIDDIEVVKKDVKLYSFINNDDNKMELFDNFKKIGKDDYEFFYELSFKDDYMFYSICMNLFYYSRLVNRIYLVIDEKIKGKKFNINLDFLDDNNKRLSYFINNNNNNNNNNNVDLNGFISKIRYDLKKRYPFLIYDELNSDFNFIFKNINNELYLFIDLINFDLTERNYINFQIKKEELMIFNYGFYLLGLDMQEKYSIINPFVNDGKFIIEVSFFNPRKPLNIKKRYFLPLIKLFFYEFKMPDFNVKDKNKYIGIVDSNIKFKKITENINFLKSKIKLSKYDFDWLDVKFKSNEIDFAILNFFDKNLNEQEIDKLFYMLEFVINNKILILSYEKLNSKYFKKYNFKKVIEKKVIINFKEFFIYILSK